MISLSSVRKEYHVGGESLCVLKDISFSISKGEFVSVMGPSGSGKSTLMHILGCLDLPTSGLYILNDKPVSEMKLSQLAQIRNRQIGFVFQNFHLLARVSALRNVELPLVYAGVGRSERKERALKLLSEVGLADRAFHLPNELSGGQKQRVAIARALANKPDILLADEPTGALDSSTGKEVMSIFKQLNKDGMTIIVITHDATVASVANRMIRIQDGEVISDEVSFEEGESI